MTLTDFPMQLLVVEDNTGDFVLIEDYLKDEISHPIIHHAKTFTSAKQALEERNNFDIILLDLSLPDASGEKLVNDIVHLAGTTPVIVLTGYTDKVFGIKSLSFGVSDYLLKDELNAFQLYKSIAYTLERKKITQQLKESEEKYRILFQFSPIPKWVYNVETYKFLNINDAAIKHYGYSKEEFLTMNIRDIRPAEEIIKLEKSVEQKNKTGRSHEDTFIHRKKNGELIHVRILSTELEFDGEKARLVIATDITKDLISQEQIIRTNQRLKNAQEIGKLGYWEYNTQTKELFWSDEVYRIFGVKKESFDLSYKSFHQMVYSEDRKKFNTSVVESLSEQVNQDIQYRIACPDGTVKYVYQKSELVLNNKNQALRLEGIIQDITSRKQEEHQLKLLESVITNATDAVLITDAQPIDGNGHKILYVNNAFTKMTGYTTEEVIGKTPRILQGPKSDRQELNRLRKALENWEPCEVEILNYKKNGEEFWISMSIAPIADSTGNFTHWISIERDVTERRNYIKAIEEQNLKLKDIAWTQSHIVRAPLARMMGLINLINDTDDDDNLEISQAELLNHILNSAHELDDIIKKIVKKTELI